MYHTLDRVIKKILPSWIYTKLIGRWNIEGTKKYTTNTGWMLMARTTGFITSFLTIAIVARYLGPENLGKLSYAQSFVAILSIFASLGMDQIIYRELVAKPTETAKILGTAIATKLLFGTIAFFGTLGLAFSIEHDPILITLIGIVAFTFVITPISTLATLSQARVQAKYTSYISIFLAFLIPVLKIIIILNDKGIIYFASILVLEALILASWAIYVYTNKFHFSLGGLQFDKIIFIHLVKDSWPFLFAGLFSYIYARIDQVMLQHFLDSASVGWYDSAVRLVNMLGIIPSIIIGSLFPAIVSAKQKDRTEYLNRLKMLLYLIFVIITFLSIFVFMLATPIVLIIFGGDFLPTVAPMKIYLCSGIMAIIGVLAQQYLIAENKGRFHFLLTGIGATLNIALNLYLIPKYGMTGAAIATLFSYSVIPLGLLFFSTIRKDIFLMFQLRTK